MDKRQRSTRSGENGSALLAASTSRRQFFAGTLLALISLSLGASTARAEQTVYRLGPNDRVRITVFGEDRLTGEFVLDGTGRLSYPLLGSIEALGKTTDELADTVRAGLAGRFILEPRVSADIAAFRSYFIMGEVSLPGQYPAVEGLTLLGAIATAKGFTPRANRRAVTVKTSLNARSTRVRVRDNALVRPGDIIIVTERWF